MDIKTVQQLAELMEKYDLAEVQLSEGESSVSLARATAFATPAAAMPMAMPGTTAPAVPGGNAAFGGALPEADATPSKPTAAGEELTAPLVGVAYRAPEPGAAPFVEVGQAVKQGQTLCIIEAMKVMNEFTAPRAGTVTEICFENEGLVEFGQCLFRLA